MTLDELLERAARLLRQRHSAKIASAVGAWQRDYAANRRDAVSKHSPGPWKACGARGGACKCGLIWSIPGDHTVAVARSRKNEDGECAIPDDEYHANMGLIASAPALAERLARAEALLQEVMDGEQHEPLGAGLEGRIVAFLAETAPPADDAGKREVRSMPTWRELPENDRLVVLHEMSIHVRGQYQLRGVIGVDQDALARRIRAHEAAIAALEEAGRK